MTVTDTKRLQLIEKLKEMFQMDQADLDFGIYRIMNAKRDEITRFLEQDLLPTLRTTLEEFQPQGLADKRGSGTGQGYLPSDVRPANSGLVQPDNDKARLRLYPR